MSCKFPNCYFNGGWIGDIPVLAVRHVRHHSETYRDFGIRCMDSISSTSARSADVIIQPEDLTTHRATGSHGDSRCAVKESYHPGVIFFSDPSWFADGVKGTRRGLKAQRFQLSVSAANSPRGDRMTNLQPLPRRRPRALLCHPSPQAPYIQLIHSITISSAHGRVLNLPTCPMD